VPGPSSVPQPTSETASSSGSESFMVSERAVSSDGGSDEHASSLGLAKHCAINATAPASPGPSLMCSSTFDDSGVDIGLLLKSTSQAEMRCFSSSQKYAILTKHFRPSRDYKFPGRFIDGCHRSCQYSYLVDNPWLVYSKEEDGLFCLPCVLFATKQNLNQFVTEKFNHWTKKSTKFFSHNSKQYHKLALTQAEALKSTYVAPERAIDNQLKKIRAEEIAKNRTVIKHIASAIHLCGKQCIALRGHRDDRTSDPCCKQGNFLAILNYSIQCGNTALAAHFNEASKNAIYTSKTIQNQIIDIIGDNIRDRILGEIKEAKYYSVLCDEVTDVSNKEQVSMVLRFVDSKNSIREEFLDFICTERVTGEILAGNIKSTLLKYGLEFDNCRGQGYDGASNMSARRGVQGILGRENHKALYVHCNSHILNLCVVQACSLPCIRNMSGTVTESAFFFKNSPKRQTFLELMIDKQTKAKKVKDLCRTRWVYRHEAYECFFELFKCLHDVMYAIVSRDNTYGDMNWDSNTIVTANGLLKSYSNFNFIYSFITTMNCMSIIKPLSIKLQYRTNDVVYAYSKVKDVIEELKSLRANEELLHLWYEQARSLAGSIEVEPEVPRVVGRQLGRDTVQYGSAEDYFRRTIALPLLDHFIMEMQERFGQQQTLASKLLHLVPSFLCKDCTLNLDEVIELYQDDLPNPSVIATEVSRWQLKWLHQTCLPYTLRETIQQCDADFFPNIHTLLRIACTLPVTSCENERANSTLERVKTSLRSTMGQERLSALVLMSIHKDLEIDLDDIVDNFKVTNNRRIPL